MTWLIIGVAILWIINNYSKPQILIPEKPSAEVVKSRLAEFVRMKYISARQAQYIMLIYLNQPVSSDLNLGQVPPNVRKYLEILGLEANPKFRW